MMNNKEQYEKQLEEAIAFIKGYSSFLIVSHVNPDGDAISSSSAVAWCLKQLGKQAIIINESELPKRLNYLYRYDSILRYEPQMELAFDAVIAVDCADDSRMGKIAELLNAETPILNIDHHATNNNFGRVNVVHAEAAATVQILFDLFNYMQLNIDIECGTALYTGLITDTGGFRYSNTSPEVMKMASDLLAIGVSGHKLADTLLEKMTIGKLKILQLALSRITFSEDEKIGWVHIDKDDLSNCNAEPEDLEGIVNYVLNVDGIEVAILFKETKTGAYKASLRSAGHVDVAAICQSFGGGGHVRAAGCTLDQSLNTCIEQLVSEIRKALT